MKSLSIILSAAGIALGLALTTVAAGAQQPAQQPAPLKPASPAAIAAARELLTLKNVSAVYSGAVSKFPSLMSLNALFASGGSNQIPAAFFVCTASRRH